MKYYYVDVDMPIETWDKLISREKWSNVELRDSRYNQIVHMTTAALGAEEFYTTEEHVVRHEGPELARTLDHKVAQVPLIRQLTSLICEVL